MAFIFGRAPHRRSCSKCEGLDAGAGIEPALTESNSVVLPLDDPAAGRIGGQAMFQVNFSENENLRRTEIIRASSGASGLLMEMMQYSFHDAGS